MQIVSNKRNASLMQMEKEYFIEFGSQYVVGNIVTNKVPLGISRRAIYATNDFDLF